MKRHNSANTESKGAAVAAWYAFGLSAFLAVAPLSSGALAILGTGLDYYNYSNAGNKGGASIAPTFAILNTGDEDRLSQAVFGFQTSTVIPTGLSASRYLVTSVALSLTIASGNVAYDPTYDPLATYLDPSLDTDAGRPLELYALGLRQGYTGLGYTADANSTTLFSEASPYGSPQRSAFAADLGSGLLRDVSDSVSEGFDTSPLAIGQVIGLTSGSPLTLGTRVDFSLNLSDPAIALYVQKALDQGSLGLSVATLHAVTGPGSGAYPGFFTKEATNGAYRPSLTIEYAIVPEPGTLALSLGALALCGRRLRRQ